MADTAVSQQGGQEAKEATSEVKQGGGVNPVSFLVRKCLDASITNKLLGILVVSLVGFSLIFIQHTLSLRKIDHLNHEVYTLSMPQYKVSQYVLRRLNGFKVSLLQILNHRPGADVAEITDDIYANRQRLDDMKRMLVTLQTGGVIQDVAKISQETLDVFAVDPVPLGSKVYAAITEINSTVEQLSVLFNQLTDFTDKGPKDEVLQDLLDTLDEMHELVTMLAVHVNEQQNESFADSRKIIDHSQKLSFFIGSAVVIVLTLATVLYIFLIVVPLKSVLGKVKDITKDEADLSQRIEVKTHDEVGQLAQELNVLVDNIYSLNSFKMMIEEDETTLEVHHRLAHLLRERYRFDKLFIYELQDKKHTMSVAYASDHQYICNTETIGDCNVCRAKRTGHEISSLEFPDICTMFPFSDKVEHHCVPMIAGGRVISIVQFLYDKFNAEMSVDEFEHNVRKSRRFIKEATPVIEAKRFATALKETTLKDPMTDLYNRRFLESYTDTLVANTMRRATRIGILMCDMDFFKEVNDAHGHEAGDSVIVKTAEVVRGCVRASDMVIRYGGEEFLVLLTDVQDREAVFELAERIRKAMEVTPFQIAGSVLHKTMSIGFSMFPEDTRGFWEAIKYADVALYRAKQEGRNMVVGFTEDMWSEDGY